MSAHDAERFQQALEESLTPDDEALRHDLLVVEALVHLSAPVANPQAVERMSQKWRAAVQAQSTPRPIVRPRFDVWRRAAAVLAFVLLAALGSSGGVVAASSSALPDETLYGVKRAWESLVVWVASLVGRLEDTLIHLAQTRYDELTRLLALGRATPQALDDFITAYERASALGGDPRLEDLQRAARLGLAQLPDLLRAAPRYEVLRAWLSMPDSLLEPKQPVDQAQVSPTPTPDVSSPASEQQAQASPIVDPILALSQTQAALAAQLEQTAQALALTQTALAPTNTPASSPTSRFAPTATRTPQPSPAPVLASLTPVLVASATPTPSATWTPLPLLLPTRVLPSLPATPLPVAPIVWTPTPAVIDPESPFIRLTIQAAHLTQTAQAAATEEGNAP
ncbi:MAG: hypothetical protein NZ750_13020 [Anaerolineae bacterium]|nr:hypothetical protein [Anaerolineae bacterium]MDW8173698.1 hypothetical protein [Anaerolineae bacterium]